MVRRLVSDSPVASGPCPRRHRRFQLPACLAPRRARPRPLGRFPLARRQVSVSQVALDSRVALDSQVALDSRVALGSRVALDSRAALVANHRRPLLCRRTCLERRQRARRPSWGPRAKLRLRRRLGQFKARSSSRCLERLAAGPDWRRRCSEPEPRRARGSEGVRRGSAARRSQEFPVPRRCGPLGSKHLHDLVCNQSQLVPSPSMMEPRDSSQRGCAKYRSHRPLPASPVRAGSLPFGAAPTRDDVAVTVDMRTL